MYSTHIAAPVASSKDGESATIGDNRLIQLAAEIRIAHAGVIAAAKVAAERAIEAGNALIEAKELVPHGQWLPWLKEHCDLSERTAQYYMKIARTGLTAEAVAEIGLKAARDVDWVFYDTSYDPFAHCDEEQQRQWTLFRYFIGDVEGTHVEWILQRQFTSPDEWLGEEGVKFRRPYAWRVISDACRGAWAAFQQEDKAQGEIEAEMAAVFAAAAARPSKRRKTRRKSASDADLAAVADRDPQDLASLADRVRALMAQNDPDILRAGLAAVADELDAARGAVP